MKAWRQKVEGVAGARRARYLARFCIIFITAALIAGMAGCRVDIPPCPTPPPSQDLEIRDWYDLAAVSKNLSGNHTLVNDLDSTTLGYGELAGPRANQGKGWEPIGTFVPMCAYAGFLGTFDGQGHEIRDLYINRPEEDLVGLFGCVYEKGIVKNIGLTNITVTGNWGTGGLVGRNMGIISNSHVVGDVRGNFSVGGLVGHNQGPVSDCYAAGNVVAGGAVGNVGAVMGGFGVGGLAGVSEEAAVSGCYYTGDVTSYLTCDAKWENLSGVGGLIGLTYGAVSNSYATGNVTGDYGVGGLVGNNWGTLSDSYSTGYVTGRRPHVGGLVGEGMVGRGGGGTVNNSFWDVETSGLAYSAGGIGKTTAQMKHITTFTGAGWNIIAVGNHDTRKPSYAWNIVEGETYPFLSWEI